MPVTGASDCEANCNLLVSNKPLIRIEIRLFYKVSATLPFDHTWDIGFGFDHNALEVTNHSLTFSGITLGNVLCYSKDMPPNSDAPEGGGHSVGEHEEQHTYQGEVLGPFYIPSNIIGGVAASIFDGDWHGPTNYNEVGPQSNPPRPW